jgi:hypothetical protein
MDEKWPTWMINYLKKKLDMGQVQMGFKHDVWKIT